ncbi:MAG TPA: hypothetical protein DIW24_05150 [Bacteroidetes bacterium]|mgnify:CR=1 FL=1|nr:hypothetical protein [Bacteroidota bacterium]
MKTLLPIILAFHGCCITVWGQTRQPSTINKTPQPYELAAQLCERGMEKLFEGNEVGALAAFNEALKKDSTFSRAYHLRGELRLKQGALEEALHDLNRAISFAGDYPDYFYARANIQTQRKAYTEAISDYTKVLTLRPNYPEAILDRAIAKLEYGDVASGCADIALAEQLGLKDRVLKEKYCAMQKN